MLLLDRWLQTARARASDIALIDLASGQRWTFSQLADAANALPPSAPVEFPSGPGPQFILQVLRAWRDNAIVCPLEQGHPRPAVENLPAGCVHVKTTSGSAGAPRLIAFTPAQLAADADNVVQSMGLRSEWPNLAAISLAHSYGFSNLILPLLLHGIPLILAPSRLPEAIRQAGSQFLALTLPAVPALWRIWRDADAIPTSVKLAISAGAALPLALEREIFERHALKIHNFYGASECGGICYDTSSKPRETDDEVGVPLHRVQLATDPENRLVVTSPAVGQTYWPAPDPALADGRFRAGDHVEIRAGRVFLQGRHGDTINIAGQKVAPETIEQAILRHPGVRECVVFGVPDSANLRAEIIVACVVGPVDLPSLKRHLAEQLPSWQLPRHWRHLPTLSDPNRSKISRAHWRQHYLTSPL